MKEKAIHKGKVWVAGSLILTALFSLSVAADCAEIKLGIIPPPPQSAKLRIFVKAISGEFRRGNWQTPNEEFEKSLYK